LTVKHPELTISGVAYAADGIDRVEVSVDDGATWQVATGTEFWSYTWYAPGDGSYPIRSRVISGDYIEAPAPAHLFTVDSTLPTTSGSLTGDETWDGEVVLSGDVTVPEGLTLSLAAGTTVRFQALSDDQGGGSDISRSELMVAGDLLVSGGVGSEITFTSSSAAPSAGDWGGIRVTGRGTVALSHAVVEYGSWGISVDSSEGAGAISIIESVFRHGGGNGFAVTMSSGSGRTVTLDGNTGV
jgi:hypothetical protein